MFKNDFSEKVIIKFQLLNMFSHLFIYFFVKPKTNKQTKNCKINLCIYENLHTNFFEIEFFPQYLLSNKK